MLIQFLHKYCKFTTTSIFLKSMWLNYHPKGSDVSLQVYHDPLAKEKSWEVLWETPPEHTFTVGPASNIHSWLLSIQLSKGNDGARIYRIRHPLPNFIKRKAKQTLHIVWNLQWNRDKSQWIHSRTGWVTCGSAMLISLRLYLWGCGVPINFTDTTVFYFVCI